MNEGEAAIYLLICMTLCFILVMPATFLNIPVNLARFMLVLSFGVVGVMFYILAAFRFEYE